MRTVLLIILCLAVQVSSADARRAHLTAEQQEQLKKIQTIYLQVLALTEKGPYQTDEFTEIISRRLKRLNYEVVHQRDQPHDVELKVKCEERKTWAGTTAAGGDAELPDAPSRLWKGPACLFSYYLNGRDLGWYKEIRTSFEDSLEAAKKAGSSDSSVFAMKKLEERIREYEFPVLLAAEWGQVDLLIQLLDNPQTNKLLKLRVLSVLSELNAAEALPQLTKILANKDLQQEAITALAGTGQDSIPLLIDLFQHTKQDTIRAEAAKALGTIAATSGDPRAIPPLVKYLQAALTKMETSEDINFPVLTQVVWAIGKLRDDMSMEPMRQLQKKVWLIYDNSQSMTELREATNWSYKQLDLDGHIS
ncbi:MAG: HEAT repeat domain-containing protein [Nitrospirales bacterium]|nr:HEAT repeat domain-containing protein [Nitrospira sp.]MDR4502650.1 HEAT repeat domain-containing protein [Nitrospirales bacterium]